jgi:hypothetical protein
MIFILTQNIVNVTQNIVNVTQNIVNVTQNIVNVTQNIVNAIYNVKKYDLFVCYLQVQTTGFHAAICLGELHFDKCPSSGSWRQVSRRKNQGMKVHIYSIELTVHLRNDCFNFQVDWRLN